MGFFDVFITIDQNIQKVFEKIGDFLDFLYMAILSSSLVLYTIGFIALVFFLAWLIYRSYNYYLRYKKIIDKLLNFTKQ